MNCLPSKPELKRLGYGRERPVLVGGCLYGLITQGATLKMAVLDGPRTPLPFVQIGNWEFLIGGIALYRVNGPIRNSPEAKCHLCFLKSTVSSGSKLPLPS